VNSFQFTRSARFSLAHRKDTEQKPEAHGTASQPRTSFHWARLTRDNQ
jgi:hypothetical protein